MTASFRSKNQSVNVRPVGGGGRFYPRFRQRLFFLPRIYSYPFYVDPSMGMVVPCIEVAPDQRAPSYPMVTCTPAQNGTACCVQAPYGWAQRCPPGTQPVFADPVTDIWGRRWYLCTSAVTQTFTPFYRQAAYPYPYVFPTVVRSGFRSRGGRRRAGRRGMKA